MSRGAWAVIAAAIYVSALLYAWTEGIEEIDEAHDWHPHGDYRVQTEALELMDWIWRYTNGARDYVQAIGDVRNISDKAIDDVVVVVEWYNRAGDLVAVSQASIDFRPIRPGDVSAWRVAEPAHPAMYNAKPIFTNAWGTPIPHRLIENTYEHKWESWRMMEEIAPRIDRFVPRRVAGLNTVEGGPHS